MRRVAWALVVLALTACAPADQAPLRVGTNVWPGYESLYLARELGHYDDTPIRLVELPAGTDVMEAVRAGRLEVAALTLDEALSLMADGSRLRAIMVFDHSNGGDAVVAKPGITSLAELSGRRIAAEKSAVGGLMLQSALEAAGLSLADVRLVDCDNRSIVECYDGADAFVTFEPSKSRLLAQGAHVVWDSSRIPGRIVDVLVATEPVVMSRPRALRELVSGYFAAQSYTAENRQDAWRRMAVREHVSAAQFGNSLQGIDILSLQDNLSVLGSDPAPLEQTARTLAAFMRSRGMLAGAIDLQDFASPRFLPEDVH